jgi:hypothetical protein
MRADKFARTLIPSCLLATVLVSMSGCGHPASITFLEVPPASSGGGAVTASIRGRVVGPHRGRHIVLYAFADQRWWVQPFMSAPLTEIAEDGSWNAQIHLGTKYAAVLRKDDGLPPSLLDNVPVIGKSTEAVAIVKASGSDADPPDLLLSSKILRFSGLDWQVRTIPGDYASKTNEYSSDNISIDGSGALHMLMTRGARGWVCSEISSVRSFGYGDYNLEVQDVSHFEPAIMFSAFTFAQQPEDGNHRAMDIHITRRGEPSNTNAEFVVQPSFVPANFYHFNAPSGPLTLHLKWSPERAEFSASRTRLPGLQPRTAWEFTTGVPTPDDAQVHINFCNYGNARIPPQHNAEVVVKSFEFLP